MKEEAARGPVLMWFGRALAGCAKRAGLQHEIHPQQIVQSLEQNAMFQKSIIRFRAMSAQRGPGDKLAVADTEASDNDASWYGHRLY